MKISNAISSISLKPSCVENVSSGSVRIVQNSLIHPASTVMIEEQNIVDQISYHLGVVNNNSYMEKQKCTNVVRRNPV